MKTFLTSVFSILFIVATAQLDTTATGSPDSSGAKAGRPILVRDYYTKVWPMMAKNFQPIGNYATNLRVDALSGSIATASAQALKADSTGKAAAAKIAALPDTTAFKALQALVAALQTTVTSNATAITANKLSLDSVRLNTNLATKTIWSSTDSAYLTGSSVVDMLAVAGTGSTTIDGKYIDTGKTVRTWMKGNYSTPNLNVAPLNIVVKIFNTDFALQLTNLLVGATAADIEIDVSYSLVKNNKVLVIVKSTYDGLVTIGTGATAITAATKKIEYKTFYSVYTPGTSTKVGMEFQYSGNGTSPAGYSVTGKQSTIQILPPPKI